MEYLFRDEQKKVKKRKKVAKSTLSFAMDDEGGEDGVETPSSRGEDADEERSAKRPKSRKNPNVDTSFLPDREREEAERAAQARRMASGVAQTGQQAPPSATGTVPNPDETMQTGDVGETTADEGEDDASEQEMGNMMQGQSEDEEIEEEEEDDDEDYVNGEGIWTDEPEDEGFYGVDDDEL